MKKNAFYFFILTCILSACSSDKFDGFTITGNLIKGAGKTVYLNQVQGNALLAVDSTKVDTQNKFSFKGKNSTTQFYIVSVVSQNQKVTDNLQLLVAPQDQIVLSGTVNGDLKSNYKVNGSKESGLIKELNSQLKITTASLDSLAKLYLNAMEVGDVDSTQKANWDAFNQKIKTDYRTLSLRTIEENDSSLISVMALFQHLGANETVFNIEKDFGLYKKVANKMDNLYPTSELVKSLKMMISSQELRRVQEKTDVKSVEVGSIAPEFILPTPAGGTQSLSALRGKYVLLDFWASWCKPCRSENIVLVKAYKKYKKKGLKIIQVSLDKNESKWKEAIKTDKLKWLHVSELKFWNSKAVKLYNVRSIPSNFLINPEGKIVAVNLQGNALEVKLEEVYKKK